MTPVPFHEWHKDVLTLFARVCMMLLFLTAGWESLLDFRGTVAYMASTDVPLPAVVSAVSIVIELLVGAALVLGVCTRPLALLMALFSLTAALLGHRFWELAGEMRAAESWQFYKDIAILGGLLLLYVTGPGRYSLDSARTSVKAARRR